MEIVAGVDCHKDSHTIVFLNRSGQPIRTLTIKTTDSGYRQAISAARGLGEVVWGLEGSGTYGRSFARTIVAKGMVVYEVPGVLTKRHRKQEVITVNQMRTMLVRSVKL